jgi:hypothetical protein
MWRTNGLSIVLALLFVLSFAGHALSGWKAHNADQREHGEPEVTFGAFLRSSEFGETVFENWQSEFLQMVFYVTLTVFLYQRGSSESKKHDGSDEVEEDPAAHRNGSPCPRIRQARWWAADALEELARFRVSPGKLNVEQG